MEIKLYDKVLLKNGRTAYIVEIYRKTGDYEADIDMPDGTVETDTINKKDIKKVLKYDKGIFVNTPTMK